jgi:DNA-binding response OmpR family regulator
MRILIIDDESALLDQLQKNLEKQRYIVEKAVDGEAALDKLVEAAFDAIILDIMMPNLKSAGSSTSFTGSKSLDRSCTAAPGWDWPS